ncbi:MAG: polymer-forming cytoskeletal protein [Sphingomonadaceae bacterium]|nr:polymer-forming cytoskeletal protein [Sphingomonadaceae bacterium]
MFGKGNEGGAGSRGGCNLSFIGADVTVTGNIGGAGNLHVDGCVDGDVICGSIIVGGDGKVNGNIKADEARVAGAVNGTISAKSLTIDASARINGDLSYDSVSIETGAQVEGRVKRLTREDGGGALKLIAGD